MNPWEQNETKVRVNHLPKCETDGHAVPMVTALFRGRTRRGTWLYMCDPCFERYGVGLGDGRGQRLEVRS